MSALDEVLAERDLFKRRWEHSEELRNGLAAEIARLTELLAGARQAATNWHGEHAKATARAEQAEQMVARQNAEIFRQSVELVREQERAEQAERERDSLKTALACVPAKIQEALAETNAEIERLRAALKTVRIYIRGQQIEAALVEVRGKPESEWPTLGRLVDDTLEQGVTRKELP